MLIAELRAECRYRLEEDAVGLGLAGGRDEVIGRQRGIRLVIQVTTDAVADAELPGNVVLSPAKPSRLDVAGNTPTIADIAFAEEPTVGYRQIASDQPEIDMPPGLRPI